MSNSNWMSVFGRDYYGTCRYSHESLELDGTTSWVEMSGSSHWPGIYAVSGVSKQHFMSLWARSGFTTPTAGISTLVSQTNDASSPSGDEDAFFRIAYEMIDGGTPRNLIYVTFRDNTIGTNNNIIERVYTLNGTNNKLITGASTSNDYWIKNNTTATAGNITTNSNDFVHLCAVVTTPPLGQPYGIAGSIDLYWNGQKLIDHNSYTRSGVGYGGSTVVYGALGCNIIGPSSFFTGQLDEVGTLLEYTTLGPFKTAYGLTTDQDVVDKLYNNGCPANVTSHSNASAWAYDFYRFESPNQWDSEFGSFPISPQGGATTTTLFHA